ncbi:MAG: 2-C-methyl-D-erythritol 4-phosphate cytidylyltransferase [Puniceicoccales bacterium]|jgi:2-C-methyl-D-erythritol 4-phosphate cytidylyltransferase|nr:2-C-methyl-D-erythritol 4-phosphate cytidylyltransferase [Puniceicoccales bacterium]
MSAFAILLASGSGKRMRGVVRDKCLEPLAGLPVIAHSARAFWEAGVVDGFVIVCRDEAQQVAAAAALHPVPVGFPIIWANGGAERQDSVLNGLEACPPDTEIVFIHDAARPLITPAALKRLSAVARREGAAVLAHKVKDSIKQIPVDAPPERAVLMKDLDRSGLRAMETPQVFHYPLIRNAYRLVAQNGARITDDVAAATLAGHNVALVENDSPNPKLTEPHDVAWAEFLLSRRAD